MVKLVKAVSLSKLFSSTPKLLLSALELFRSPLKLFRSAPKLFKSVPKLYISKIQFYTFMPEANTFTPADDRAICVKQFTDADLFAVIKTGRVSVTLTVPFLFRLLSFVTPLTKL
jgi:hypothetical protein